MEVALRHRRQHLRRADRARAAGEVSGDDDDRRPSSGFSGTGPRDEEPVRAGVLGRGVPLCWRRGGGLRLDADAARRLHRSAASLAAYSISIFFLLRAAGRFLGAWMLTRVQWQTVLALFSGGILCASSLSVAGGVTWAVYLLPLSGLFMSVIYPTLNSKGISCLPKSEHGAGAGVILFFTCVSAVLAPLAMGAVSDAMGRDRLRLLAGDGFAALLFIGPLLNWSLNPTRGGSSSSTPASITRRSIIRSPWLPVGIGSSINALPASSAWRKTRRSPPWRPP